jgi:aryl-alcohol dehydrogenase-like predicted oxidoreductase
MLESRCCGWKTLRALDDLIRQGKVRYIGCSNWQAWRIATALGISACLNLARFNTLQAYYSIAGRDLERELVPLLEVEKLGLLVWSPLAGGLLSGRFIALQWRTSFVGKRTRE